MLVSPWFGHFDDTDAQLYQVVVRKMASSHAWWDPSYLKHVYPHFREHLPFGLWPYALATAAFGERIAPAVAALFSFATLLGIAAVGRRLLGPWPALAAVAVLAATDTFFRYGGAVRLDPPVVLLANAAAVPALLGWKSRRSWLLACSMAALAMLVKPPFGVIPLLAASGARAIRDRSWASLFRGVLGALLACMPLLAFLAADRAILHAGWWDGYLRNQILGSALGSRNDGAPEWWFPLATLAGRFWPGLVLIAVAAFVRRENVRLLWTFCALMLFALCLPGRKVWNHALIAYPGLALLAGSALAPISDWLDRHAPQVAAGTAAVSAAVVFAAPFIGRAVDGLPCVGAAEFSTELDGLAPGDEVLVVSSPTSWRTLASLAAERRLEPDPREALPPAGTSRARIALVQEGLDGTAPGWGEIGRARGWILLRRAAR